MTYQPTRRERSGRPHAYSEAGKFEARRSHHGMLRRHWPMAEIEAEAYAEHAKREKRRKV